MTAPKMYEDAELIKFFDFVQWQEKLDPRFEGIFHVANERRASWAAGKLLKQKGVRSGVCDIIVPIASSGYHGLFIELKIRPNKLTVEQSRFIDLMIYNGFCARVVWSGDEAIELLREYLRNGAIGSNTINPTSRPRSTRVSKARIN